MTNVDPEALADVAYGIFEYSLNRGLRIRDKYLYALVEGGIDFKADLSVIFNEFSLEYPQLAEVLLQRFSDIDTIYGMLCNGEGVVPSKTTQMYWIVQDAPGSAPEAIEDEKAGKWLIFQEPGLADAASLRGAGGDPRRAPPARGSPAERDRAPEGRPLGH